MKSCPSCSFLVPAESETCTFCGVDIHAAAEAGRAEREAELAPAEPSPPASRGFVVAVVAAASVAVGGVGWWAVSGGGVADDGRIAVGSTTSTTSTTAPVATSTTLTQLTTTTAPPKVPLAGRTVAVGVAGVFSATMPAGTREVDEGGGRRTWIAPSVAGSELHLAVLTGSGPQDAYRNSLGRLDFVRLASVLRDVGNRLPTLVSFPAGPGAQWAFHDAKGAVRITMIDGRDAVFIVAAGDPGDVIDRRQLAAYLSVIDSIRRA